MQDQKLIKFCLKNGILVDKDILNFFNEIDNFNFSKKIIEKVKEDFSQKMITKSFIEKNKEKFFEMLSVIPDKDADFIKKLKIKFDFDKNLKKELKKEVINKNSEFENVKLLTYFKNPAKKIEVSDFVKFFKNRFIEMRNILQENSSLKNLTSINKLSDTRQAFSVIGLISEKRITKNKNILFEIEDLTGKMRVLINKDNEDLYNLAEEISLDSVIGFGGFGNNEILFTNNIIFPEAILQERKKSNVEEYALFIGDLHYGSKLFFEKSFLKFIDYLNGKLPNTSEVDKIKYLFLVGDVVAGVGNYPGQEKDLLITDIEQQFIELTELLKKINPKIKLIISPGNHDGVGLAEPQPFFNERYAWSLYTLKNAIITGNPALVNIGQNENFSGMNVLTYHGFSYHYYGNNIAKFILEGTVKHEPDKLMAYLLKNRHVAPTHTSTQYYPNEKDNLIIKKIPDIFVSAHTHKSGISYYNNILIISVSAWENITPYQEKMGNQPDFCKVPLFNMKTRAIKILDFEEKENEN